jgi:hypothetical protein
MVHEHPRTGKDYAQGVVVVPPPVFWQSTHTSGSQRPCRSVRKFSISMNGEPQPPHAIKWVTISGSLRKEFASMRIVPRSAGPSRTHVYILNLNTLSGQHGQLSAAIAFQTGSQFESILCQPRTRCSRTLVKRGHHVNENIAAGWVGLYLPSCPLENIDNVFMATERL